MKLSDGVEKLCGTPAMISNCSRDELPEFFKSLGFKIGAEVGVYKGQFTKKFCDVGIQMFAIDPWQAFQGQGRPAARQERQDFLHEHTKRLLADHIESGLCTVIRQPSMKALHLIGRRSLDFVYIDGDHDFPHVAEDIYYWSGKVKVGGVVSGHDFYNTWEGAKNLLCHVGAIVEAYTKLYRINKWWVFGTGDELENNSDRGNLSWMWFNGDHP